jgi:hypothetical protein
MNKELKEYWETKYAFLTTQEIALLKKNKGNCSFDEWYIALQYYAELINEDNDKTMITGCGEECWKEAYDDGMTVDKAFQEGFED